MEKHRKVADCLGSCCLQIRDLTVRFGAEPVLDQVNLHMHCGDIVALIGPNGAGKSTLLKAVLGLVPCQGEIRFHTADGREMKPLIGYVPQNPRFDRGDPISVLDLFAAFLSAHPVFLPIGKKLRARIAEALQRVHAENLIDRQVGALSGGELQRVLLALALEPLPNVLILDEPTSGIDVDGIGLLIELIEEIRSRFDLSILMTTHDFSTLGNIATKVVLIKHKVLISGSPQRVFRSPQFRDVFHISLPDGGERI